MQKTTTKSNARTSAAKSSKADQGLSQSTKNWVTVIFLCMYFIIPLLSFVGIVLSVVGLVLMWAWTKWKLWVKIVISIPIGLGILAFSFPTIPSRRRFDVPSLSGQRICSNDNYS
jgi:hypothetical protein